MARVQALLDPASLPSPSFKLQAVQQPLKTLSLFDEALAPGRQLLLCNAKLWSQVASCPVAVCVEDFQFAQVEIFCEDCIFDL